MTFAGWRTWSRSRTGTIISNLSTMRRWGRRRPRARRREGRRMTRRSNSQQTERRAFGARLEVRKQGEGDAIGVKGHAAVFDRDSLPLWDCWMGTIVERIAPGAFTKTIQEADIRLLINHDPNL